MLLLMAVFLPACKDAGGASNGNAVIADTLPKVAPIPEIVLTFTSGNVAPSSMYHVFGTRNVEVEKGDFSLDDLDYQHFTLTVLFEDTAFARIVLNRPDNSRQRARFVKGEENVPRMKMPISGFVDKHMTAWMMQEVENYIPEGEGEPRERPKGN